LRAIAACGAFGGQIRRRGANREVSLTAHAVRMTLTTVEFLRPCMTLPTVQTNASHPD
jgi:hypothetical protein